MARRRRGTGVARTSSDPELEAVVEQIEDWRRTRVKRTRMPEELWTAGVMLTGSRSIYGVSQALRVNYETLRSRALKAEIEGGAAGDSATGFVELPTVPDSGTGQPTGSVVELTMGQETRLTIRLPVGEALDVAGLAAAFLGVSR